ncbi:MAG: TPM domain-containing protein [Ignavibacteria bacterium]|nr:TPM domain-containing protein [Ignavibacteria bacterium]
MAHKLVDKYFTKEDLAKISDAISENEKKTSGEIRISISEKRPVFSGKKSLRQLAEKEFFSLKMDKTRDKTGILIYLLLEEKSFYILGDSGINKIIGQNTWDEIRNRMQQAFKSGNFLSGTIDAVNEMGNILAKHFPIHKDDTNELPNEIVVK